MVHTTTNFRSSRTFRIRKRSLLTHIAQIRVVPVLSILLFLFGSAALWYSGTVQAGVAQLSYEQVSAGGGHTCAVGSDNRAYCWGGNTAGQLGNNSTTQSTIPVAVDTSGALASKTVSSISSGDLFTCAIASDNQAYCWGSNTFGQLGNNSTTQSNVPVAVDRTGVLAGKTILSISTGSGHACVIASDNQAYCWGQNSSGQLGNNSTTQSNVPVAVDRTGVLAGKTVTAISANGLNDLIGDASHTCAIASDNQAYCWGYNGTGQLGNNSTTQSNVPVAVDVSGVLSGKTVKQISAGAAHTCAVASDSQAYCWGYNYYGQLGDNSKTQRLVPVAVTTSGVLSGKTVSSISSGGSHTCAVASDAQAYCWGFNMSSQLGDNSTTQSSVPVAVNTAGVLAGKTIKMIASAGGHRFAIGSYPAYSCAIASDSQVYCWGVNNYGQLGNNSTTQSSVPVAVNLSKTPYSQFAQTDARFYANADNITPGSPLAGSNYPAQLTNPGDSFRLRTGIQALSNIKQFDNGDLSSCAVTQTGQVYCWGAQLANGSAADSAVPIPLDMTGALAGKTVLSVSVGGSSACAVASDNRAYCWGDGYFGQLGNNSTTGSLVPVAVDTSGVLAGKDIISISVGGSVACAIASDNQAYCWGDNASGQLGNNSTAQSNVPVAVMTSGALSGKTILSVSVGGYATCAIASDNRAYCWGEGYYGQLGNNSTAQGTVPVAVDTSGVLSGKTILTVSVGYQHVCAIASDNQAYCWGNSTSGQLGNNTNAKSLIPVAVTTSGVLSGKTILTISANLYHTCAIASDNQAYCWGDDMYGQLGNGLATSSSVPVAVTNSSVLAGVSLISISGGYYVSCALDTKGSLYCWGSADSGNLGNGSVGYASTPVAMSQSVLSGKNILKLSVGMYHTCAITSDNQAYCWGLNAYGQLGNNSTISSTTSVAVTTSGTLAGKTILSISAGLYHTCAIASDNQAYCWGDNDAGQLGNNSTTQSLVPVAVDTSGVLAGKTITSIEVGDFTTCVIASDNQAYCWGYGGSGQLGNNSTTDSSVPVAVDTSGVFSGKTILSISAGSAHTCAIASDNQAYCWGRNSSGQLGNNSTTQSLVPAAVYTGGVLAGKSILSISAGMFSYSTCVVASDNQAYCWGYNYDGRLGNNSTTNSSVPVAVDRSGVLSGKTVASISTGPHTCVIASDNQAYCWGDNSAGQLGNNQSTGNAATNFNSPVPSTVSASDILSGKTMLSIGTGGAHTCAMASDNQVYCWGSNFHNQLGNSQEQYAYNFNSPIRVHLSTIPGSYILPSDNTFKLQFATRSAATCSGQTTGFADVTASTAIAYNTASPVTNGSAITSNANDPVPPANSSPQTFISQPGTFTNTNIIQSGKVGLWDFALKDNSLSNSNTTYCFRLTYGDGTPLEAVSTQYPEITTAPGVLSVGFVDGADASVINPTFAFTPQQVSTSGYNTSSATFSDSSRKLRVFNSSATNGWSLTLAPTAGPTALWNRTDNNAHYDFNDPTANAGDGADLDTYGGQLSDNTTASTIASPCALTGLSKGSSGAYSQGATDTLTLMSASSAAAMGCNWDLTGLSLTQTFPSTQPAGTYTLDMTATVVAM